MLYIYTYYISYMSYTLTKHTLYLLYIFYISFNLCLSHLYMLYTFDTQISGFSVIYLIYVCIFNFIFILPLNPNSKKLDLLKNHSICFLCYISYIIFLFAISYHKACISMYFRLLCQFDAIQ